MFSSIKKDLYFEKSLSHREKPSSQRLGREVAQSGAPTNGPVTLERPPAPPGDPVRKHMKSKEWVFPAVPKGQEPGTGEGQREWWAEWVIGLSTWRGRLAWEKQPAIRRPDPCSVAYQLVTSGRYLTSLSHPSLICKMGTMTAFHPGGRMCAKPSFWSVWKLITCCS